MTKADLISRIYDNVHKKGWSKASLNEVIDYCFHHLSAGIKKDKRFTYPGFGTWTVKTRKARTGRNPQTGETIKINAYRTVTFRPSSNYKKSL